MVKNHNNFNVFIILLVALITRFWGITSGLPNFFFFSGEGWFADPAMNILKTGDINPHNFTYPSLFIYLVAIAGYIYYLFQIIINSSFINLSEMPIQDLVLAGRILTGLFGVCTVFLIYNIGKKIFNHRTGLLSAGILAAIFVQVLYTTHIKNDVPALFFGLISFLFSYYILAHGELKFYILAGIFTGLAAATGYNAIFFIFPIITAHALRNIEYFRINAGGFFSVSIFLAVATAIFIGFFAGCPFCVIDYTEFTGSLWISRLLSGNPLNPADLNIMISSLDRTPNWLWYIKYLASSGLYYPIFLSSVGGIIVCLSNLDKKKILLLSFTFIYSLFLISGTYRTDRLTIFLTPFFAILSAIFIERILNKVESGTDIKNNYKKLVTFLILFIVIAIPLIRIFIFNYTISQYDTRETAAEWIESNMPKDNLLLSVGAEPITIGFYLQNKGFRNVLNLFPLNSDEIFRYYGETVIISEGEYNIAYNYREHMEYKKIYENYLLIKKNGKLIKKFSNEFFENEFFSPNSLAISSAVNNFYNPTIKIYEIPELEYLNISKFNKTLTLDDIKQYSGMTTVSDISSPTGFALFVKKGERDGYGGPYSSFPAGSYDVIYHLKTNDIRGDEEIASLSVQSPIANGNIYASKKVFAKDFIKTNEYQEFKLPSNLTRGDSLQTYLVSSGSSDLWLSKIEIIQR